MSTVQLLKHIRKDEENGDAIYEFAQRIHMIERLQYIGLFCFSWGRVGAVAGILKNNRKIWDTWEFLLFLIPIIGC
jgi:hypothetical protein